MTTTVAFIASGISASVVCAIVYPDDGDIVSVLGAMLATFIAVVEARKKDRDIGHTCSVVISCAVVGSTTPGLIVHTWYPEKLLTFTWHAWAALGFMAGLVGWIVTAKFYETFSTSFPGVFRYFLRKFGLEVKDDSCKPK